MDFMEGYELWLTFDMDTRRELQSIKTCKSEIEDRFGKELTFGTGGMRGKIGAGTNRMNRYTVAKVTFGYGAYLQKKYSGGMLQKGIVIAYDTRFCSEDFAYLTAQIMDNLGIRVYLFQEPTPTPILSFAIPHLKALGGIVITASHNPKEYNGYKIYNHYGGQLVPKEVAEILPFIEKVAINGKVLPESKPPNLCLLGESLYGQYMERVLEQKRNFHQKTLAIVYSPLHGTGKNFIPRILHEGGYEKIYTVEEQRSFHGSFPTVTVPNPEDKEALSYGIALAKEKDADIVFATDPDCDRIGVAVKDGIDEYTLLSGNDIGGLLVDYLLKKTVSQPKDAFLMKTIVTGTLGEDIGKSFGCGVIDTLTGFKFIGEKITQLNHAKDGRFLLGYEESCGYLWGSHAKDKDAIAGALLIADMADEYKRQGDSLLTVLETLYQKYGYRCNELVGYTFEEPEGMAKIEKIMKDFRSHGKELFSKDCVVKDYLKGIDGLPPSNVIKIIFPDNSWLALRPSGTEPKLKVYYEMKGETKDRASSRQKALQNMIDNVVFGKG